MWCIDDLFLSVRNLFLSVRIAFYPKLHPKNVILYNVLFCKRTNSNESTKIISAPKTQYL